MRKVRASPGKSTLLFGRDISKPPAAARTAEPVRPFEGHYVAEVLLRMIRARADAKLRSSLPSDLDDDEAAAAERRRGEARLLLAGHKPDVIAAAVIVGHALAGRRATVRKLLFGSTVVQMTIKDGDDVADVASIFRRAFDDRAELPNRTLFRGKVRRGICTVPAGTNRGRGPEGGVDGRMREALQACIPVVVVAVDPRTATPDYFERLVEERLVGAPLSPQDVAFVIRKTVGAAPKSLMSPESAGRVRLKDLAIAVQPFRGADESLAMLEKLAQPAPPASGPRLSELAGYGPARAWGLNVAQDLAAFARSEIGGDACPRGAILHGPPGTGKTIFARSLAAEANVPFFFGSLAEWQSRGGGYLGTTLGNMRLLFETARDNAPCIALIDELDGFGSRGQFADRYEQYWTLLVDGLLELLDGAVARPGVVVIGATNHVDRIDPAIQRSGRFDKVIRIDLPTVVDLVGILRFHLADDLRDVDLTEIAESASGWSGADCAALVRHARARARRIGRALSIADLHFEAGVVDAALDPASTRTAAYHEAGHALVAVAFGLSVREIAIGSKMRSSIAAIERDCLSGPITASICRKVLRVAMGGRAAEIVMFGEPSAGDAGDLEKATRFAISMIFEWGLGGTLTGLIADPADPRVEHEVRTALEDACSLLANRKAHLNTLAKALIVKRRLKWPEIVELVGTASTEADRSTTGPKQR